MNNNLPPYAGDQLAQLCRLLEETLPSLDRVVLHGSAASAGFEADRSDLDVLVIVKANPGRHDLAQVGNGILSISGHPYPLELSIISSGSLSNWRHPCPHLLHFSEELRERYQSGLFVPNSPTDEDLAMHLVIARARGVDLLDNKPVTRLPEIPRCDYLAAILSDFKWAENKGEDASEYAYSNACRTLAYLRDGLILSKSEGRHWCVDQGIGAATVIAIATEELQRELAL